MITRKQILNAKTDTHKEREAFLGLAGEMLQPEHEYIGTYSSCVHCSRNKHHKSFPPLCKRPILLTWPEAMKWRDWAVKEFGFADWGKALGQVHTSIYLGRANPVKTGYLDYILWLECGAQPEHYIKAACLCKIGGE